MVWKERKEREKGGDPKDVEVVGGLAREEDGRVAGEWEKNVIV